jgi:hypothetical protein
MIFEHRVRSVPEHSGCGSSGFSANDTELVVNESQFSRTLDTAHGRL